MVNSKPTRNAGESWTDHRRRIDAWKQANNMQEIGGKTISKDSNQWSDDDWQTAGSYRAAELGQAPGQHTNPYHVEQERQRLRKQVETKQQYDDAMKSNWSPQRQADVDRLYNSGQLNYDEYMQGAHDMAPGPTGYQSQGNTIQGYRPDGTFGWYDKRDHPGWTSEMGVEMFAPSRDDLNAATAQGYDVTNMGRDQAAQIAQQAPQQQMPQWGQPQQQQQMPQWGSAPQGTMAGNYGWGAGLGGPPQQSSQQQQWAMQPWGGQPQYQTPPSGGRGVGQMGVSGGPMPQWGGTPQQQAMPQWGQMMQQQPMGGPMAGMEAARMGGGAMQQMGGGSPWASMWGDPFAGRQMTTDPNSPAMGGLPQMDPTQQLLMQMMGGGGGLSGGFGDGGGSSGGGGASGGGEGAYQTPPSGGKGVGQTGVTGGDDPYGSLANILALFAGGGGGGGGGGAPAPTHYGGLPRNGLYYANLMGG